ncbi:MAG: AAA family ATPase [Phycisphaerales bacterium]|nr:AAA family ATPase [Phycisphaerales bacterium]
MSSKRICVYHIDDPAVNELGPYKVAGNPSGREELRTTLGAEEIAVLLIDIDQGDAFDAIVEALEIRPALAVIGVTGTNDVNKVIRAQRAGCRQITSKPLDENDLLLAIRKSLNEASGSSEAPPWGKTLSVIGTSGGAGATTLACYLAMSLSDSTKSSVSIIDLDLEFGTVAKSWDLTPRFTVADLAHIDVIEEQHIEDYFLELPSGISVLPRPEQIDQAQSIDETIIRNVITSTKSLFPYLVMDLPRKLDAITGCAIEECDKLILVAQLTVPGILNAARLTEGLVRFGVPIEKLEFVVNRYNKKFQNIDIKALEEKVGKKVIGVVPNHYKSLSLANDLGEPVSEKNPIRKAISEIATKLCGRQNAEAQSGSWISSLGFGKSS